MNTQTELNANTLSVLDGLMDRINPERTVTDVSGGGMLTEESLAWAFAMVHQEGHRVGHVVAKRQILPASIIFHLNAHSVFHGALITAVDEPPTTLDETTPLSERVERVLVAPEGMDPEHSALVVIRPMTRDE